MSGAEAERVRTAAGLYARGLSGGSRAGAELLVGPAARFTTDLTAVYVPWPLHPALAGPRALLTCVALQTAPTKALAARVPFATMSPRQRTALQRCEGALALDWLRQTWPGLYAPAGALAELAPEPWAEVTAEDLAERALRLAATAGRGELYVPAALGALPVSATAADGLRELAQRARSRLPFSLEKEVERVRGLVSFPVGGSGGAQAPANGVPEGGEPPDFGPATGVGRTYDEWDCFRDEYRRDFVTVLERRPPVAASAPRPPDPALEAWFSVPTERQWRRELEDGADVDVDAIMAARADELAGHESATRVYRERAAVERDVAVALLIDSSGSLAQGSLLRHELRCADALVAALAAAGGRFGVFAFFSDGRSRVVVDELRGFSSRRDVRPSSARLQPQGYTRLGAPIRHLTDRLGHVPARRRALLVLTDGLPCDDGYEGPYAWFDVEKAVIEAELRDVSVSVVGVGEVDDDPLAELLGPRLQRVADQAGLVKAVARLHRRLLAI